jgi:N-acetyl-anhydromuramyl-L-alanine amidase AmpD
MTDILKQIKLVLLPEDQYFREATPKTMIFLHHTAGNANPLSVVEDWARSEDRIATSFVIGGKSPTLSSPWTDGQLIQCFSSSYWAYHLGVRASQMPPGSVSSSILQKQSIGIEICNFGWVKKRADGKFINYVGGIMKPEEIIDLGYDYRGYRYWHAYTDAQIETVRLLLLYLCEKWNIPQGYKGIEMFELDNRAFKGESGIWTHDSVRIDKTDCSPQPKLIDMLKSL